MAAPAPSSSTAGVGRGSGRERGWQGACFPGYRALWCGAPDYPPLWFSSLWTPPVHVSAWPLRASKAQPLSQVQHTICVFLITHELRIVFTFLNGQRKKKKRMCNRLDMAHKVENIYHYHSHTNFTEQKPGWPESPKGHRHVLWLPPALG